MPGSHVLPEQQPVQDTESQTHPPSAHCCPVLHAGPVPHWQVPLVEQLSAVVTLHVMHAPPLGPHAASDSVVTHTEPEQHPFGHEVALHTHVPLTHSWPWTHAAPVLPHSQVPEDEHRFA